MAKNAHFYKGRKIGRSNATPIKHFWVDSYDLKSMSIKFGNDIFIIFEMPRSSFLMSVGKMNISFLFRPSASEVLALPLNKLPFAVPKKKIRQIGSSATHLIISRQS
jgi:hypothetical protein